MADSGAVRLTRDTKAFVDALAAQNAPPLYTLSPAEARQVLIDAQSGPATKAEADIKDVELPVGPKGKASVRIVRPKGAAEKLPLIFYCHGGGWIMGNKNTHDRLVRAIATGVGAVVVFPDYVPSPESQYPDPLEEAYAVFDHVVKNGDKFGVDTGKIVMAGDSVGGNMATVLSLLSGRRGGPKILFQLLFYPVTDANFDSQSYYDFADGPWLTRKAMEWFWDAYLPDKSKRNDVTASPLQGTAEQLKGLPPALVITAENDVLRDEGEAYARKLDEAGVRSACLRCNGTMHDFLMLDALSETAPARMALSLGCAALKRVFK